MRAFPKDAVTMPAHIDQVVKMKNAGMQWQRHDVMYRQKREKRIARGSKKVSGWARQGSRMADRWGKKA